MVIQGFPAKSAKTNQMYIKVGNTSGTTEKELSDCIFLNADQALLDINL